MRILIVHNRYQQKGGEDVVVAAEEALLRSHGHEVSLMHVDNDHIQGPVDRIVTALGSVYSVSARGKMAEAIRQHKPDLVHIHNFFPTLSPSVFIACHEERVPVVQTLHNFRIQCAASTLYRDGHVCEECITARSFLPGVRHACYRSSHLGSAISGFTMALHSRLGTWQNCISAYIALTEFAADKLGSFRIPRNKIFVKPNSVLDQGVGTGDGDYALFVGRLSPEKGIQTLIDADRSGTLPIDVVVLGDGPMRPALDEAAALPGSRLRVKGFSDHATIVDFMRRAKVLLLTSLWYEAGLPLVALEAMSLGLPIIAAEVGNALAIAQNQVGILYPLQEPTALSATISRYLADASRIVTLRQNARDTYMASYTPEVNYRRLIEIYDGVLAQSV